MAVALIYFVISLAILGGAWMNVRAAKANRETSEILRAAAGELGQAAGTVKDVVVEAMRRVSAPDN